MKTLFADTYYFFALLSVTDIAHGRAVDFTADFDGNLLTTAWVLTELADGMAEPANRQAFASFIEELRSDPRVTIIPPEPNLFEDGLKLYAERTDKPWSLTDCMSFIVMRREGVTEALTGDHHFEQAGFAALLK